MNALERSAEDLLNAALPGDGAEDWARPLIERQLEMLGQLAEIGLDVARAVGRQATEPAEIAGAKADIALAYARVSRAVRLTIALQARLIKDLQQDERAVAKTQAFAGSQGGEAAKEQRQERLLRIVGRVIDAELDAADLDADEHNERAENLIADASERLDDEDLYGELLSRPFSEVVDMICADLGLSPDWPRLAQEAWAREEMRSGEPGSPLAALMGEPNHAQPPPVALEPSRASPHAASP